MKVAFLVFALLLGGHSLDSAHGERHLQSPTPEALGRQVWRSIIRGDSASIHALVPTVNDLFQAQEDNDTPGAFKLSAKEVEDIVQDIDSVAMASYRRAREIVRGLSPRRLRVNSIAETEQVGDMPYRTIVLDLGEGSLTCSLEIRVAMGYSGGWKLGHQGFELYCVQPCPVK